MKTVNKFSFDNENAADEEMYILMVRSKINFLSFEESKVSGYK